MLFRAVILSLFTLNVWSAGVPIESLPAPTIPSFPYTPVEPEPASGIEDYLKDITPIEFHSISAEVSLPLGELSAMGIKTVQSQTHRYAGDENSEFTVLSDDKLYIYSKSQKTIKVDALDFNYSVDSFEYPALSSPVDEFILRKHTAYYGPGGGVLETHIWPYVFTENSEMYYWYQDNENTRYEGQWRTDYSLLLDTADIESLAVADNPKLFEFYFSDSDERHNSVGVLASYRKTDDSGLWLSGNIFGDSTSQGFNGKVSPVTSNKSTLLKTHLGTAQFYIYKTGESKVKFITEIGFPEWEYVPPEGYAIKNMSSIYSEKGTLYFAFINETVAFIWHDKMADDIYYVETPSDIVKAYGCEESQDKIFCIMKNDEHYVLYELVDGELKQDRVLDHELLDEEIVGFNGIYAHGDNRFVAIKTADLRVRLFNFTETESFLNYNSNLKGAEVKSVFLHNYKDGMFFWLVFSSNTLNAKRISVSDYDPVDRSEDGRDGELSGEDVEDGVEEEKEIPYAEMEGSLNIYLLMLALLILMPLRFAKK